MVVYALFPKVITSLELMIYFLYSIYRFDMIITQASSADELDLKNEPDLKNDT